MRLCVLVSYVSRAFFVLRLSAEENGAMNYDDDSEEENQSRGMEALLAKKAEVAAAKAAATARANAVLGTDSEEEEEEEDEDEPRGGRGGELAVLLKCLLRHVFRRRVNHIRGIPFCKIPFEPRLRGTSQRARFRLGFRVHGRVGRVIKQRSAVRKGR